MKVETLSCRYRQPDLKVQQVVNLKLEYFWSENTFIRSLIEDIDGLIIFRVGSVEAIRQRLAEKDELSEEERIFISKVRAIIY